MIPFAPDKTRRSGDCILWTAGRYRPNGAGMCSSGGLSTSRRAHRVAYELAYGPIPDDLCIFHTCNIAACVNVEHLWAGTRLDKARWDRLSDPSLVPRRVVRTLVEAGG